VLASQIETPALIDGLKGGNQKPPPKIRLYYSGTMSYGATLRDARLATGLTLEATAANAGCSTSYVHKLELDRVKSPSPRVLERLAGVLKIDYTELMREAGYAAAPGQVEQPKPSKPAQTPDQQPSNATILRVLMDIRRDLAAVKSQVEGRQ
jgi:transcriptional regulator with XRE-family HTH domain